jgi:hypothetical protein
MMMRPAEASATNDTITWREARYLARVVQMLVRSPSDRGEFRRELEHLLRAAEALRAASARSAARAGQAADLDLGVYDRNIRDLRGRDLRGCDLVEREMETATEGAVVELWRSNAHVDYERLQATASVTQLRRSAPAGSDLVDESTLARAADEVELACAVDEIERAAALLRAEERRPAPVRIAAADEMPPVKQQIMEFWLPVAAAMVGMLAAVVSFFR